ncbi:MAG TPA: hypothetical protein VFZ77_18275 [Acidimicrobiales bacterium]
MTAGGRDADEGRVDRDLDRDVDPRAIEGLAPDQAVISPGDMLNVYEYQAIRLDFAEGAELRPDQVLMTPYGYAPLPRPPLAAPDGRGKLPATLALEYAGHPVFWLDDATKRQGVDEHDDAFAIRLYLELVDRGYLNPGDGRLRNPLVAAGLDVRDAGDRARLAAYRDGAWDATLCDLAIPPDPGTPPGAIAREAARLHGIHAEAYQTLVDAFRETVRTAVTDARATLRGAAFHRDAARLIAAGEALRRAEGPDLRAERAALDRAYRWLLARITHLDDARIVLTIEVDRRSHLDAPRGAASYAEEIRRGHARRCDALEPHMSAVYASPDEARLRALLVALSDAYHAALGQGLAVLAAAEGLIGDLFATPPAPTGGIPPRR